MSLVHRSMFSGEKSRNSINVQKTIIAAQRNRHKMVVR